MSGRARSRVRWLNGASFVCATLFVAACVGSESGRRANRNVTNRDVGEEPVASTPAPSPAAGTTQPSVLPHRVAEVDVESGDRITVHLLLLDLGTNEQISATIRAIFDSLSRAEPALAAARAVAYTGRENAEGGIDFVAGAWGSWEPPEGWAAATVASRRRPYRSFVYHVDPGWSRAAED